MDTVTPCHRVSRVQLFVDSIKMPHKRLLAGLIIATFFLYVSMVTINALGGAGTGLFNQTVGEISDKYTVFITPAGWTFSIWSVIYIYLAAGVIYSLANLFRTGAIQAGATVYAQEPTILNWFFYAALMSNFALNTAWIIIWLNELITAAAICLLFIMYTAWAAFGIACYRGEWAMTKHVESSAIKRATFSELRWQRAIIHNGIALYGTWTTVASLLNLNTAFQYVGGYDAQTTSLVCLSVLLAIVVGWFVIENTLWDRYVRYTLTQYIVVMFAAGGILSKQMDKLRPDGPVPTAVHVLTWIVLGVSLGLFILRLIFVFYRYYTHPLFSDVDNESATAKHN